MNKRNKSWRRKASQDYVLSIKPLKRNCYSGPIAVSYAQKEADQSKK